MIKLLNKIKNIIFGTWFNVSKKNNELAEKRLQICKNCPSNHQLTKHTHMCIECGCILESKARVKSEECLLNKW